MSDNPRARLTQENGNKVREVAHELNMSYDGVVNMILSRVSAVEMKQIITFVVEVREGINATPRRKPYRREVGFTKRF